ncbi:MAG: phosphoserine transaminase [Alphaproteobacteria bacterium]|nr:phosphoserine transaminase [Alphaproteobacteria bacterium]
MEKPAIKPTNPCFSSGPCAKRPGWSVDSLKNVMAGRSHRAAPAKAQIEDAVNRQKALLGIPDDYLVGIVPGSDTGAFELALWNVIGSNPNGTDVLVWEAFSGDWCKDVEGQLKPDNLRVFKSAYGHIPDLSQVNSDHDVVFVWNGTTSGVRVPDGEWIAADRKGLTICDATSAVFAMDLPWEKLDIVTWSWQKALGSEAAHGMLVLSPRAVDRICNYKPKWPLPKLFRIKKGDAINAEIFKGATINTPSMLAVADCLDALDWVESVGGLEGTIARTNRNFSVLKDWVVRTDWAALLPASEKIASTTSVCLKVVDEWFESLGGDEKAAFIKSMTKLIDKDGAAYDIASYRDAPAGLRIWCGATVESSDLEKLLPWLEWAFATAKSQTLQQQAA